MPDPARVTTAVVEVLCDGAPQVRVSTAVVEVLCDGAPPGRITTLAVEALVAVQQQAPVISGGRRRPVFVIAP